MSTASVFEMAASFPLSSMDDAIRTVAAAFSLLAGAFSVVGSYLSHGISDRFFLVFLSVVFMATLTFFILS